MQAMCGLYFGEEMTAPPPNVAEVAGAIAGMSQN